MYWITGQLIGHSNNWLQTEFTTQETRKIINVIVDLLYWFSLSCFFSKWRRVNNTAFHAHPNTKLKYHNDNGNQQRGNGKYRRVEKFSLSLIHSIFTRHNLKCTCRVSIYQFSRGFFSLSLFILVVVVYLFFLFLYFYIGCYCYFLYFLSLFQFGGEEKDSNSVSTRNRVVNIFSTTLLYDHIRLPTSKT